MIKVKLTGYGILKDYVGSTDQSKEYYLDTAKPIRQIIADLNIPEGIVMLVAINDEQKDLDYLPKDGDEIKLIPPVSGG